MYPGGLFRRWRARGHMIDSLGAAGVPPSWVGWRLWCLRGGACKNQTRHQPRCPAWLPVSRAPPPPSPPRVVLCPEPPCLLFFSSFSFYTLRVTAQLLSTADNGNIRGADCVARCGAVCRERQNPLCQFGSAVCSGTLLWAGKTADRFVHIRAPCLYPHDAPPPRTPASDLLASARHSARLRKEAPCLCCMVRGLRKVQNTATCYLLQ